LNRARLVVLSGMALTALVLALATAYTYGRWFSHDRYWHGTVERVQARQTALIRSLLTGAGSKMPQDTEALAALFSPVDGVLVVEVRGDGELRYSNFVSRFVRGGELDVIELAGGWRVDVMGYQPPSWNRMFVRWLRQPARWLEPSFDHITMPFLWFLVMYAVGMLALGLAVKSSYLQRDVLMQLRRLEERAVE
jgi:hypothetical protein